MRRVKIVNWGLLSLIFLNFLLPYLVHLNNLKGNYFLSPGFGKIDFAVVLLFSIYLLYMSLTLQSWSALKAKAMNRITGIYSVYMSLIPIEIFRLLDVDLISLFVIYGILVWIFYFTLPKKLLPAAFAEGGLLYQLRMRNIERGER